MDEDVNIVVSIYITLFHYSYISLFLYFVRKTGGYPDDDLKRNKIHERGFI